MPVVLHPVPAPLPGGRRLSAFRIKAAMAIVVAAGLAVFGLHRVPSEPAAVPFRQYASAPAAEADAAHHAVATTLPQWRAFWPGVPASDLPPAFDPARHVGVAIPVPRDFGRREEHVSVSSRGDRVVVVIDEPTHAAGGASTLIILRIDRPGAVVTVERRVRD